MRHANITMTTKYGSSMAEGMRAANSAVVRMAMLKIWQRDRDSNLLMHRNLNNLLERVAAYTAD